MEIYQVPADNLETPRKVPTEQIWYVVALTAIVVAFLATLSVHQPETGTNRIREIQASLIALLAAIGGGGAFVLGVKSGSRCALQRLREEARYEITDTAILCHLPEIHDITIRFDEITELRESTGWLTVTASTGWRMMIPRDVASYDELRNCLSKYKTIGTISGQLVCNHHARAAHPRRGSRADDDHARPYRADLLGGSSRRAGRVAVHGVALVERIAPQQTQIVGHAASRQAHRQPHKASWDEPHAPPARILESCVIGGKAMIVVTGATGRTGRVVAEALLSKGEAVRVIGRDTAKLTRFAQKGAETFSGDVGDGEAMVRAFQGADAVYLVLPEDGSQLDLRAHQERVSDSYAAAVAKAHVPYVVAVSSIGAERTAGTGPIVGLHNMEQKLNRIAGLNVLYLRAAYFMENLFMSLAPIRTMGKMPGGLRGDWKMPWIATQDIGTYAARRLAARDFSGSSVQELHGQRDLSMNEAAAVVGPAIGKPGLAYVQAPGAAMGEAMAKMGVPAKTVALMQEMWEGANAGLIEPEETRSQNNTTPTTIEWFVANVFAPAYQHAASA